MIGKIKNFQSNKTKLIGEKKINATPFSSNELVTLFSNLKKCSNKEQFFLPVHRHLKCQMERKEENKNREEKKNEDYLIIKIQPMQICLARSIIDIFKTIGKDNTCRNMIKVQNIVRNPKKTSTIKNMEPIKALEFKKKDKFLYSALTNIEKKSIKSYCRYILNKKPQNRCDCILRVIGGLFKKNQTSDNHPKKCINRFIYVIGNYILEKGKRTKGIFRISGKSSLYKTIPKIIKENGNYNPSEHSIHDNASIFKAYIRDILNGLIPEYICKELLKLFKGEKGSKTLENIIFYTRFIFDEEERNLFIYLKRMFKEIDQFKEYNCMTQENLFKIFTPSLFPDFKHFELHMINQQIEFIKLLFNSDFENVPDEILQAVNIKSK